jgi:carboxymethylenebutenolidase
VKVSHRLVDLDTPTGPMRTHVWEPAGHGATSRTWPGLLLYSEIFQITEPIARLGVRFAGEGHCVAAPEIYYEHESPGTVLGYDDEGKEKGNAYKHRTTISSFDTGARAALDFLASNPRCSGRLGTAGVCIGGHLSFRAAFDPRVAAAACFFPTDLHSGTLGEGKRDGSLARAVDIRGELMMVWGRQDPHIPFEGRVAIQKALHDAGTFFTWHEFNCEHAFLRDEGARFDPEAAREAIGLAIDLFRRTL